MRLVFPFSITTNHNHFSTSLSHTHTDPGSHQIVLLLSYLFVQVVQSEHCKLHSSCPTKYVFLRPCSIFISAVREDNKETGGLGSNDGLMVPHILLQLQPSRGDERNVDWRESWD